MTISSHHLPLSEIFRRSALPFALFTGVLAGLMILSWYVLLPLFTRVNVGGSVLDLSSLLTYRAQLQAELLTAEEARAASLLPIQDPSYEMLKDRKRKTPSLLGIRRELRGIAAGLTEQPDAVHLSTFKLLADSKTLQMTGDVRFVGPRSMTILAQFIEALEDSPLVASVALPRFVREEDPVTGPHSPFSVHLTLR